MTKPYVSFNDLSKGAPKDPDYQVVGKVATVAQLIALAIVLGAPQYGLVAAVIAGGLGTAAAVVYGWRSSARSNRIHSVTRPVAQREMSITASSAP